MLNIFYLSVYFTTQKYRPLPVHLFHNTTVLTSTCPSISQHKSTDLLPVHLFHNTKVLSFTSPFISQHKSMDLSLPVHLFHNTTYWPLPVRLFHNTKVPIFYLSIYFTTQSTDLYLSLYFTTQSTDLYLSIYFTKVLIFYLSIYFTTQSTAKPGEYKWVSSANSTQSNWRRLPSEMLGFFLPLPPLIIIWSQYLFPRHDSTQT